MSEGVDARARERIEALEARVEAVQVVAMLLVERLDARGRAELEAVLAPLRRRIIAERPMVGEEWPTAGLRALAGAVAMIEEALEGADHGDV